MTKILLSIQTVIDSTLECLHARYNNNDDELRRVDLMFGLSLIGILFLVLLGTIAFFQGGLHLGIINFSVALLLVGILYLLWLKKYPAFCIYAGVSIMYCLYFYLFVDGGIAGNAFLWSYTFPLFAFFLLGAEKGLLVTSSYFLFCSVIQFLDLNTSMINLYDKNFIIRFIPSFFIVILLSFAYEKYRATSQEDLIIAKNKAEAANRAKSDFLANISHELRTPMHGILNYSRFGIERIDKVSQEKIVEYFSEIEDSGQRLMVLLNDLLDLAKFESGKMHYVMKENDMTEQIAAVSMELLVMSQEKETKILKPEFTKPATLQFDRDKIAQVLRNLLSNAIKFSNRGAEVQFKTSEKEQSGKLYLQVTIADQGVGLPEEELASIFDKFIQSSRTQTGAGGTGLGLAICKQIIEDHNGQIWAEHNPEGGSLFCFTLPRT